MNKTYSENITIEEIKELNLSWFEGEIFLVDNMDKFYQVIPKLKKSKLLGFDTETKPSFKKGRKNKVSLLQLSDDKIACLFRINRIGLPDELAEILSDPEIIKKNLISQLTAPVFVRNYGIECSGLKKLTAIILGFRISKSQQVTDWEAKQLSEPQLIYAATDAWVCHEIYKRLID